MRLPEWVGVVLFLATLILHPASTVYSQTQWAHWSEIEDAAQRGNAEAQVKLGLHHTRIGLLAEDDAPPRDWSKAYLWLTLGIEGYTSRKALTDWEDELLWFAREELQELVELMTEEEFQKGEALLRERQDEIQRIALAEVATWRVQDGINLNARTGPGTGYPVVTTLPSGTAIKELDRSGDWSRVMLPDQTIAFVHNRYLVEKSDVSERPVLRPANGGNWEVHPQGQHFQGVTSIGFCAEGHTVATGSRDNSVRLWEVATGRSLRTLTGHSRPVTSVAFSPGCSVLATASEDTTARLWNAASGETVRVLEGHAGGITGVVFSPDGRTVATGSHDGQVILWDAATGRKLRNVSPEGPHGVDSIAFSPDGRGVVVGTGLMPGSEGYVSLLDALGKDGRLWFRDIKTEDFIGSVAVAFSPDGRTIAATAENSVWLLDAATGRVLRILDGHSDGVRSVAFGPDGRTAITGSKDKSVRLWDVSTGRQLRRLRGTTEVTTVAFGPDGRIAVGFRYGKAVLWDIATEKSQRLVSDSEAVYGVEFSPNGELIASTHTNKVSIRDSNTGHLLMQLEQPENYYISDIAFSHDGRTLASGSGDGTVRLWDTATGHEMRVLKGHSEPVYSVAFSPDDRIVATGAMDDTARLWDVAAGQELRVLEGHSNDVNGVAFSSDGRTLATGSEDATARLWDVATGRLLRVFEAHGAFLVPIRSVEFSPDGRTLAAGSLVQYWRLGLTVDAGITWDSSVRLWDVATGQQLRVMEGHSNDVTSVAFSSDGRTLATGSKDATARLWDVATGRQLRVLEGHSGVVMSVAFSADSRTLATGSDDGTVRLWDTDSGRELALLGYFDSPVETSQVVMTPEGYFDETGGGSRHINLVRGFDSMTIDRVYDALYRPDLVREALAGDPDGKVAAAAAKLDLGKVVASGLPPRLAELRSLDGETVDGEAATVSVEVEERDGGIGRVEWRVNGTVQGTERGLGTLLTAEVDTVQLETRVFLAPGENVVSVVVYNEANLIASDPVEITVTSTRTSASKPSLHVLAAGVNDYYDSRLRLNYAVSDAVALGTALKKAGRGLYESVNVTYLLDEQVSVEGISEAFAELGEEVRPHDAFVFFLAGHGKTVDGRYYFLPRAFRYLGEDALESTAISQVRLQEWVAQVPAQKSVLLFDTCESGSLTQEMGRRGLEEQVAIDKLSRAVGRTILTASTDTEPALEGYRQHGLFTYTLLEALALADHNEDGAVVVTELIGYVDERLPMLSEASFGFRQVPTHMFQGSVFALGKPVTVLPETEEIIPTTPTHVVILKADILESASDSDSVLEVAARGRTLRVIETAGGWSLVASEGVKLGWIETSKLLELQ